MAGCYVLQMDQKRLNTFTLHIYVEYLHEGIFSWIAAARAACTERYITLLISRPSRPTALGACVPRAIAYDFLVAYT